jgi:imidazolonepropionase-like amidohydrolase
MTRTLYLARTAYADWESEPVTDAAVLVDGDRVVAFGRASELSPSDAVRVDLGAVVLAPGFVDGHVHLHFDGGADPISSVTAATDEQLVALAERNAALLVSAGVTTARDLGSRGMALAALRSRIDAGDASGPSLLLAGSPVTSPRGHCWFLGGEVADTSAAIALVDAQADSGADWVKVMVSGGFLTAATEVASPQFAIDALAPIVAHAHDRGLRVSAHAHSTAAVRTAARAGADTIEHATFIGPDGIDFAADVVDDLLAAGTAVCPTANAATVDYPHEYGVYALVRLRSMVERGVPVLVGTDAGVAHVTGDRYAEGLLRLAAAGFSTRDVLVAATAGAARILGLEREVGAVRVGGRADLVAFAADPLADLAAARHPTWVLAAGRALHGVAA